MLALLILLCAATLAPAKQLGWQQLFDGHDLKGWKHVGPGGFTVEHGLLKTQGGMGLLYWTEARWAIARSRWCTGWSTRTTTPVSSSASRASLRNPGCRSTADTRCKSTTIPSAETKTTIT